VAKLVDLPAGRQAHYLGENMYCVYIIKSLARNYVYVGLANCLKRRVGQHQKGRENTTAPYRPFELVHVETFPDRLSARKREKYLKSGCGKEWVKSNVLK